MIPSPWVVVLLCVLGVYLLGLALGLGLWCGYGFWAARADRRTFGTTAPVGTLRGGEIVGEPEETGDA